VFFLAFFTRPSIRHFFLFHTLIVTCFSNQQRSLSADFFAWPSSSSRPDHSFGLGWKPFFFTIVPPNQGRSAPLSPHSRRPIIFAPRILSFSVVPLIPFSHFGFFVCRSKFLSCFLFPLTVCAFLSLFKQVIVYDMRFCLQTRPCPCLRDMPPVGPLSRPLVW